MSMVFTINNSPFFGREGKFVTSRHLNDRLALETEKNLALKVEPGKTAESFNVFGRGILHLSILVETMRREGYEFQLGQPQVLIKEIDGKKHEPFEMLSVHGPEEFSGKIIELVTNRQGEIRSVETRLGRAHLEFMIPSRGLIGLRNNMLTATEGEAVISHRFLDYQEQKGEFISKKNGAIVAMETGTAIAYSLDKLQDRGKFYVGPMEDIYEGMVVGENNKQEDITVNLVKTKKLSNMRASGSDDKMVLAPPIRFSLEESMEIIREDEYLEVTPKSLRLRKKLLKEVDRKRAKK
jgi:GTP-binding protein